MQTVYVVTEVLLDDSEEPATNVSDYSVVGGWNNPESARIARDVAKDFSGATRFIDTIELQTKYHAEYEIDVPYYRMQQDGESAAQWRERQDSREAEMEDDE